MNIGTENRNKVIAALALGVVALVLMATRFSGIFNLSSSSAGAPAPATLADNSPVPAPAVRPARNQNAGKRTTTSASLDPTLREDLLRLSELTKYEGTGRNIFKVFVEPPPPVKAPVITDQRRPDTPPPPPPPPPINLKFYGFATSVGGIKRIFLAKDEDVFIAKEGDIVDRRYKVVRISPNAVEILDVLSNNRQSIPLTQG